MGISQFIRGIDYENLHSEKLKRLNTLNLKILKCLKISDINYSFDMLLSCKKKIDFLECYVLNPKQFLIDQIECIKFNIVYQLNFLEKEDKNKMINLIKPEIYQQLILKFSTDSKIIEFKSFINKLKDAQLNDIIYQTTIDEGIVIDQQYFINLLTDVIKTYKVIKKNNLICQGDNNLRKFKNLNNSNIKINLNNLNKKQKSDNIKSQFDTTLISSLVNKLIQQNEYDVDADNVIRELYQEKFDTNIINVRSVYGLIEAIEGVKYQSNSSENHECISSLKTHNHSISMTVRYAEDKDVDNIGKKIQRKNVELVSENIPWSIKLIKDWKRMSIIFKNENEIQLQLEHKMKVFGNNYSEEIQFHQEKVKIRIQEIKNGFYELKSNEESGNQRDVKIIQEVINMNLDMAFQIECQLNLENLIIYKKVDHILQDFERAQQEFELVKSQQDRQEWMEGKTRVFLQVLRLIFIIIAISSIGISIIIVINDINLRLKTIWHANEKIKVKFIEGHYPNNVCYTIDDKFISCVGYTKISTIINNFKVKKFKKLISNGDSLIGIDFEQNFLHKYPNDQYEYKGMIINEKLYDIKQNNNLICQSNDKNVSCIHKKVYPDIISIMGQSICVSANNNLECSGEGFREKKQIPVEMAQGVDNLSAGDFANCASKESKFICWGTNIQGQNDIPKEFDQGVDSFVVGPHNICATLPNLVKCWGKVLGYVQSFLDFEGDQGNDQNNEFINLNELPDIIKYGNESMQLGQQNGCAVKFNKLYCWGLNYYGINDIPSDSKEGVSICAITQDIICAQSNKLQCWGSDNSSIQVIPQHLINLELTLIGMAEDYICVSSISMFECWGEGQVDLEDYIPDYLLSGVDQLAVGSLHLCASIHDQIGCYQFNDVDEFDISKNMYYNWNVPSIEDKITYVYHCDFTYCIFKGYLICQIVENDQIRTVPTPKEMMNSQNVKTIIEGIICGINNSGTLLCWNTQQTKFLSQQNFDIPDPFLIGTNQFGIGVFFICASTNELVDCWGSNHFGTSDVPYAISGVKTLSVQKLYTCVSTTVRLTCWGIQDDNHQVLYAPDIPQHLTNGVDQVEVGGQFVCALKNRQIYCWGQNKNGELDIPQQYKSGDIDLLSVGDQIACAQRKSILKCWGRVNQVNVPKYIGNNGVDLINSCDSTTCGLINGEWVCWGFYGVPQRLQVSEKYEYTDVVKYSMTDDYEFCSIQKEEIECRSNKYSYERYSVDIKVNDTFLCMQVQLNIPYVCYVNDGMQYKFLCFTTSIFVNVKTQENIGDSNVIKVSCGTNHACAMQKSGEVVCFGGSDEFAEADLPEDMKIGAYDIHTGRNSTCILTSSQIICKGKDIDTIQNDYNLTNLEGLDEMIKIN